MKKINRIREVVELIIFGSKWMLIPFYIGLIIALGNFIRIDVVEVFHYLFENDESKSNSMMFILELIDMAMIAALVRMIIIGGYTSFICKNHSDEGEKTSSGVLKVKLSTAIIGVSSINLLQTFMNISSKEVSWDLVQKQLLIHSLFIIGGLVMAYIEFLHVKAEFVHHEDCCKFKEGKVPVESHFQSEVCKTEDNN